ncbi:hypothetical protein BKE17_00660 [Enhydrobacter sp. H5]|nr:hypothetical protein BKE17_00660 [Enhydrobacter sp. H5]
MYPMPSLQHLAPSQLITLLQQFNTTNNHAIYPIWLNNEGQNVIGLLPKTIFEIHSQNQLTQKQRQNCSFDDVVYCDNVINTGADTAINRVGKGVDIGELTAVLEAYQHHQLSSKQSAIQHTANVGYQDGLMGFISYDLSAHHLANANHVQASATHGEASYLTPNQPQLFLGHYDIYLTFENNHWQLHATTQEAIEQMDVIEHWLTQTLTVENKPVVNPIRLQPIWQTSDYERAFYKVQDYLTAGDCYQINLTQCWQGELSNQQLVDYLPSLHQSTNAPFAGYLGLKNFELLSCSPELFFTFAKNAQGENCIITKPIKGTRPRGQNVATDQDNKNELASSEKDIAENVMIVDLLRNDLGKYAKTGTVKVPKLFDIESFSNVHHMVSTITATLKDDISPWTVLFESLPAGSITGTPKKRAVEIINELEAKPRGAYCGTMGYLNFDGTGQWNVLIRTLQALDSNVSLWAGGGITIASDCGAEYQECFDKVGNLLKILHQ